MIFVYVLVAILVLMLMITIHEFGHYLAGRLFGFGINEFSIGFGPKLFQRKSKKTGELFSVRALPLGGYCAFSGEEEDAGESAAPTGGAVASDAGALAENAAPVRDKPDAGAAAPETVKIPFTAQKPWKRIIVLFAGAAFNMLSAFVFSFIYILAAGYSVPVVDMLYTDPYTGNVYASGLETGDRIVAVDGTAVSVLDSFTELTSSAGEGESVALTVLRGGEEFEVSVKKQRVLIENESGGYDDYMLFGFRTSYEHEAVSVPAAMGYSFPFTMKMSGLIISSFGRLITGQIPITELSGPVGTVAVIAEYSEIDWRYLLMFLPLIASNLAIFNILPIPSLDGARIVFTVIEWIRGKPVNRKVEAYIHGIGLLVLLGFVIVVDLIGMVSRFL